MIHLRAFQAYLQKFLLEQEESLMFHRLIEYMLKFAHDIRHTENVKIKKTCEKCSRVI